MPRFSLSTNALGRFKRYGAFLSMAALLPLLAFVVMHLFVLTSYTGGVFHEEGFFEQYSSGIYRYRILGRELLLRVHDVVRTIIPDAPFPLPGDALASRSFYASYLVLNGAFAVGTGVVYGHLCFLRKHEIRDVDLASYFYFLFVWSLSLSVVTPYDQMAYFFLALSFVAVRISSGFLSYAWLGIVSLLGALTRETQLLFSPALLTIAFFGAPALRRRRVLASAYHLIVFGACYLGLRIHYGTAHGVIHSIPSRSWKQLVFAAVLLALVFGTVRLALRKVRDTRIAKAFLVLSLPYSLTVALSGLYAEIRLVIPLILCLFIVYSEVENDGRASLELAPPGRVRPKPAAKLSA